MNCPKSILECTLDLMGQKEMELREKCYGKEFKRSNKLYGSLCDDGGSGVILPSRR